MPDDIILAAVGNSRFRLGLWTNRAVAESHAFEIGALENPDDELRRMLTAGPVCVLADVNASAREALEQRLAEINPTAETARIGVDIPLRLRHSLDDDSTVGVDRLLNAYAAFDRAKQACIVVDAGTAVTVDFVDGEGVFQGGVIAPGVRMMLDALHQHTHALPSISFETPDPGRGPFGKDTTHAMRLGVRSAVVGLVRDVTERFAEKYGAYPQIVATGGDAGLFEREDGLVEHIVPDLQLLGMGLAFEHADEDRE